MARWCECCSKPGIERRQAGTQRYCTLCDRCAAAGHALQTCLLCGGGPRVFDCQFLQHFVAEHPGMLEKVHHGSTDDPPVKPDRAYIGTLRLPQRGGRW